MLGYADLIYTSPGSCSRSVMHAQRKREQQLDRRTENLSADLAPQYHGQNTEMSPFL